MRQLNSIYAECPQFLKDYLVYMSVIKGKSENTIREYFYDLRMFLRFVLVTENNLNEDFSQILIKDFDFNLIKKITLSDLYSFIAFINNEHSSNDCYRARKVASLKSFFKYLYIKDKSISEDPAANLESPKIKKRLPKYLSVEQSVDLLKAIDGEYKKRDLCIFLLFLTCGLRLSELVNINISDINFAKRSLRVVGKGNKERIVYLNDLCINTIKEYIEIRPMDGVLHKDKDALFLSRKLRRISNRMVEILAKKYFIKANIDPEKYTPHKLRHTAATIMYREGNVDIRTLQELLGHASLSTTQLYTHVKNEGLISAAENNPLANVDLSSDSPSDSE